MNPGTPHAGDEHVRAPGHAHPGVADSPDVATVAPAPRSALDTPPGCPRCGYDQSGAVATWAEACPLRGTCPECGYEFAWREVFNPDQKRLPRFVEHCRRRAIPLAAVRTLLWALIPGRFWKRVKLHHEVRKRRWVVWLLLALVGWHGLNVAAATGINWATERANAARGYGNSAFSRAQRGLPAPVPFQTPPLRLTHLMMAVGEPWALYNHSLRFSGGLPFSWTRFEWRKSLGNVALGVGFMGTVMMPLVLYLIPQTRRAYKVRLPHVMRGTVFSFSWLVVPLAIRSSNELNALGCAMNGLNPVSILPGFLVSRGTGIAIVLAIALWLWWWWTRAIGRSWQIPHAGLHAAALVAIAMMVPMAVLAACDLELAGKLLHPWGDGWTRVLPHFIEKNLYR